MTRRSLAALGAAALLRPRASLASDTTIEISSVWGADKPFQKVVDAYNARRSGVVVVNRFDGAYEDAARKTLAAKLAGKPPALMITGWKFAQFARRTLGARDFREIDATRAQAVIDSFLPSVHPLVTVDGALIGLPWAMSTPITYFDTELWQAAGLDPAIPQDFDTDWLFARAREIHARLAGKHPTYRSAIDLSNNEWTSQSFIQNAGGAILDSEGRVSVDSEMAQRGMALYAEPARTGLWVPVSANEQVAAFDAGALAITTTSSASALGFVAPSHRRIATARFPSVPGQARRMNSGGNFMAVYTQDRERAMAAMDFLAFCASVEGQRLWSAVGYLNTSVYDIALQTPLQAPAAAQLRDGLTAETVWPGTHGLQGQDVWRKWVTRVLTTDMAIDKAMVGARTELSQILAS
jgi:multiple sugar transport system substrate-binding protein